MTTTTNRSLTSPAKANFPPICGRRPVLQNCALNELSIDPDYQRGIEGGSSQALIRQIAAAWDWRLCQPLVVAARRDGLFVIDGQHRLEAARRRGDIGDLPCVVVSSEGARDEAELFTAINASRRPLGALDLFRAMCCQGDNDALLVAGLIEDAGLSLARHTNYPSWKPGWIGNIAGIRRALRDHGERPVKLALKVCAAAFAGERLRYFGTIFPGVAALFAREASASAELVEMLLQGQEQAEWAREISGLAIERGIHARIAAAIVMHAAWLESIEEAAA